MAKDTKRVAVLGTGTMGAPMAANVAKAGLDVAVWNRTRASAEPLAEAGAEVCDQAADAVADADVVVTMLFDADSVAEVMDSALTSAKEGAIWIQCSTVGVAGCRHLAALASEHGVTFVDAPVLGTRQPAEKGQLIILASGPDGAREACKPVFDAMGTVRRWLGPAGAGSALKMVVNSWLLAVMGGTATCVALAERLGLDPQLFLETIDGGSLDCAYTHMKGEAIMSRSFQPSFALNGALKDCKLALEACAGSGPEPGLLRGVGDDLQRAADQGHGDEDMAALYYALVSEDS